MQMLKREMEDIKKENVTLKKTAGFAETIQKQLSVSQRRNSELVTEKKSICKRIGRTTIKTVEYCKYGKRQDQPHTRTGKCA